MMPVDAPVMYGFDEPRWFEQKSAIFSAGLRDMDAILGRDDASWRSLQMRLEESGCYVCGCDRYAGSGRNRDRLSCTQTRMSEKKINLPILTVNTDGMEHYDREKRRLSGTFQDICSGKISCR